MGDKKLYELKFSSLRNTYTILSRSMVHLSNKNWDTMLYEMLSPRMIPFPASSHRYIKEIGPVVMFILLNIP